MNQKAHWTPHCENKPIVLIRAQETRKGLHYGLNTELRSVDLK